MTGARWGDEGRRTARRQHMIAALREELGLWEDLADEGRVLEKHRSQLTAVRALIEPGLDDADRRLAEGRADEVPALVLDLFHVWDFFRGRFMLRRAEEHHAFLGVADELAWECYRPLRDAAMTHGADFLPKEPPLVGFSRHAVPHAHRRGSAYRELLPRGGVHTGAGLEAVKRLPFPVIEIPWHCRGHLPSMLTVVHEVAHHVEDDFSLTDELHAKVAAADLGPSWCARWTDWIGEAFADVCASVVGGPAYALVLADLLDQLGGGAQDSPVHPPAATRLALCRSAATAAGHPLNGQLGTEKGDLPVDPEADLIAHLLLSTGFDRFHGARLVDLLPSAPAAAAGRRLLAGMPSGQLSVTGAVAAAALAFHTDPAAYDVLDLDEPVLVEAVRLRPAGTRAAVPNLVADRRQRELREAARCLLAALTAPETTTPDSQ
ncbi:hypothetical protein ACFV7R_29575 [Streptomyces sp. NPDC059866]|uniref:hypothetical protein n=1 Tax=Streptomyces sp. NPDC059866 TaxID=3346978 RepID=UPI003663890C